MNPRLKRWLRRGLLALLLLPLLVLATANAFLSFGLQSLINPHPERLQVTWSRAWMVEPGTVEVRGLEVRGQTAARQWWLGLDRARVRVDLGALRARRFLASEVVGTGFAYRQRRRVDAPVETEEGEEAEAAEAPVEGLMPPIPGLSNPPRPAPEPEAGSGGTRSGRSHWEFALRAVTIGEVREVWLDQYHYQGTGTLSGSLHYAGGELELPALRLELPTGTMWLGEQSLGEGLVRLQARLEPMAPRQQEGTAFLRFVTAELEVEGQVADLALLRYYLRKVPWLNLDGRGQARAMLKVERGRLLEGSRLDLDSGQIEASYLGYRATGTGSIHGGVRAPEANGAAAQVEVLALLDRFELGRGEQPYIRGSGFRLELTSPETDLLAERPPIRAVVELPDSELPDLRCYNTYLPADAGFSILGGSGRIRGRMELATGGAGGRGEMALSSDNSRLQVGAMQMAGRLEFDSQVHSEDLLSQDLLLEQARLRLTAATVTDATGVVRTRGWWGKVTLNGGRAQLNEPRRFTSNVQAQLRDSEPLLDLFAGGSSLPSWSRPLLTVREVRVHTRLRATPGALDLEELVLSGNDDRVEVLGELRMRPGDRNALLFVRYGRLSAAAQIHNRWSEWRLRGAREWYGEIRDLQFAQGGH